MTTVYEKILPRARLGFIIPSSNRMVEAQATRFLPPGISPHFTRIGMTNRHKAPLEKLTPRIVEAAELLSESRCDVIVLQCTGTSMSGGVEAEKKVMAEMTRATGVPSISAASSLTAAFDALKAKKLVFTSETAQDHHEEKKAYLREAGYDIIADKAVGLSGSDEYSSMPPKLWYDTALSLRRDDADIYFLSCANIHATDAIEGIEAAVGKPVVTSNQAAFWWAMRTIGLKDSPPGLGRLVREH
jgi:maleate isomerase